MAHDTKDTPFEPQFGQLGQTRSEGVLLCIIHAVTVWCQVVTIACRAHTQMCFTRLRAKGRLVVVWGCCGELAQTETSPWCFACRLT